MQGLLAGNGPLAHSTDAASAGNLRRRAASPG
jgi:hypothetical protein